MSRKSKGDEAEKFVARYYEALGRVVFPLQSTLEGCDLIIFGLPSNLMAPLRLIEVKGQRAKTTPKMRQEAIRKLQAHRDRLQALGWDAEALLIHARPVGATRELLVLWRSDG